MKNKLFSRLVCFVCALVVFCGCFGSCVYYADTDETLVLFENAKSQLIHRNEQKMISMPSAYETTYSHYAVFYSEYFKRYYCLLTNDDYFSIDVTSNKYGGVSRYLYNINNTNKYGLYISTDNGASWSKSGNGFQVCIITPDDGTIYDEYANWNNYFHYSDAPIKLNGSTVFYGNEGLGDYYNPSYGYLTNITRTMLYLRGEIFYNYNENSLKYLWSHSSISSKGIDLTSGQYAIRHYVKVATVNGYEKENIISMSDMYLMGEYDASLCRIEYLYSDYRDILDTYGAYDLSFIDKYLKGYFLIEHHYFQIVNTETGEYGGYLHLYPHDSAGDNFGVEYDYEGLDDEERKDEDYPDGYIETDIGVGEDYADAEEDSTEEKLGELSGVNELISVIESIASQIGNVTQGISAFISIFPPWIVVCLGIGVCLIAILFLIKVLRG